MLIAYTGYKQSGKDTAGRVLIREFGYIRMAFADPLKVGVKEMFNFSDRQVYGDLKDVIDKRYNTTPRKILQIMGTEVFQFYLPTVIKELKFRKRNHWGLIFKETYRAYESIAINNNTYPEQPRIVITDLRFPHEAKIIKDLGGYIIRIKRYGEVLDASHTSEPDIDKIEPDYTIHNNGISLTDFERVVKDKVNLILRLEED